MNARQARERIALATAIIEQREWIEGHGETLAGYILNYGSHFDAEHYGDGGEYIYAADLAVLNAMLNDYQGFDLPESQAEVLASLGLGS